MVDEHLEVTVESEPGPVGCPDCGAVGVGHGRQVVRLVDIPSFGRPVTIIWRKRRFLCPGAACEGVSDGLCELIRRRNHERYGC
ncbi:transposase family protein [Dietzia maris]|uniref:transposase family protein n=1 Tax=Dietzia maris TaxID=37915 RepID=UPI0034446B99